MKKCYKCKKLLSLDNFHKDRSRKDGLVYRCNECTKKCGKKYREANRKKILERIKKWRRENKDRITKQQKKYRESNKESKKEYCKAYYEANKEKINERNKKYYENNREKFIDRSRRRRALKISVNENYTKDHEKATMLAFNYKCHNCGSIEDLHIDHHKPLSKGNALSLSNAVVLCRSCNSSKGTNIPEQFYDQVKLINANFKMNLSTFIYKAELQN